MLYLALANIALILYFSIYMLILKRLTFFQWNRIYLISAVAVSFLVPLLQFVDLSTHQEVYAPLTGFYTLTVNPALSNSAAMSLEPILLVDWVKKLYVTGCVLSFIWLAWKGYVLYNILRRKSLGNQSFAFFNRVFIGKDVKDNRVINDHELVHVKQGHSYDILFLEMVRVFNWFNPVCYLYLKEIKLQHECIADEICAANKVQYAEMLIANAMQMPTGVLTNAFSNHSFLKQRIMMLFKNKSKKVNQIRYMVMIPLVLFVSAFALVFNNSIKAAVEVQVRNFERLDIRDISLPSGEKDRRWAEPEIGDKAFKDWFIDNYRTPDKIDPTMKDPFMYIRFDVSETGELSNFTLREGDFDSRFFEEAVRLIGMNKWKPATKDGQPVAGEGIVMFKFDASGKIIRNFTRIDVNPEPTGGIKAWKEYLAKYYKFPEELMQQKKSGDVVVSFVVDGRGEIKDLKTLKEPVAGAGKRAHEPIAKFGAWNPGILDGKQVSYSCQLTIHLHAPEGYGTIEIGNFESHRIKN